MLASVAPFTGSSPRMRGKPRRGFPRVARGRLIPAHAGKTSRASSKSWLAWAHPRACGENSQAPANTRRFRGSSPRMRGKPLNLHVSNAVGRLIPAHAGKTSCKKWTLKTSRAHPRACGENLRASPQTTQGRGSSPRMRGKRRGSRVSASASRLIPAHAGKTPGTKSIPGACSAHPRACGENTHGDMTAVPVKGSSPRMRGKPGLEPGSVPLGRLIPAHAGKTWHVVGCSGWNRAHPRACGENLV